MKNIGQKIVKAIAICALVAVLVYLALMVLIWASFTFGANTDVKEPWGGVIARELNLQIDGGVEEEYIETHGGFLGDGLTYIRVDFADGELGNMLAENSHWKQTPLTENVYTVLYGSDVWQGIQYSYNFTLPEVENGYYYFLDRQSNSYDDVDLMHRASFNFTFALYDLDETKLYFIKFDT